MNIKNRSFVQKGFVVGSLLLLMVSYQNCSESSRQSVDFSSSTIYSEETPSPSGTSNLLLVPKYYESSVPSDDYLGTCVIANVARDATVTVSNRATQSSCQLYCKNNRVAFSRDYVTCTFDGVAIAGGFAAGAFTERYHCTIKASAYGTLVDNYTSDLASCKTQCQRQGELVPQSSSFECYWQNRIVYKRSAGTGTPTVLGACSITATISSSAVQGTPTVIATMAFASGTTESQCDLVNARMGSVFTTATISSSASGAGFTPEGSPLTFTVPP